MNLENQPQKNTKNQTRLPFLAILTPNGSLRGGRASHFFNICLSLGPFWAPLGSKWCQGLHYETIFLPCWVRFDAQIQKNVTSSGKQSQTSIQKLRFFSEIGERFVLCFIIFGLILCAEYSPRGNGSSGGYRKEC